MAGFEPTHHVLFVVAPGDDIVSDDDEPTTYAQSAARTRAARARRSARRQGNSAILYGEWTEAQMVATPPEIEKLTETVQPTAAAAKAEPAEKHPLGVPVELLELIFSHLDTEGLQVAESVSEDWHDVIMGSHVWQKRVKCLMGQPRWIRLAKKNRSALTSHPGAKGLERQIECRKTALEMHRLMGEVEARWGGGLRRHHNLHCASPRAGATSVGVDEGRVVTGHQDGTVIVWSRIVYQYLREFVAHRSPVVSLALTENWLATGSTLRTVKLWDWQLNRLAILRFHDGPVACVCAHEHTLATAGKDGRMAVWNVENARQPKELFVLGLPDCGQACDIDGEAFVSATSGGQLKVWSLPHGRLVRKLTAHDMAITCLRYRYPLVLTGAQDGRLRVWHLERSCVLHLLDGQATAIHTLDLNDRWLMSGSENGTVRCWDMRAVLDPQAADADLCKVSYNEQHGRINALACDDYLMVTVTDKDIIKCYYFDS